jgi:SpoVK/Ycf46/Vps4 family AAA+-type ATPase
VRESDLNIYDYERLRREFGPVIESAADVFPRRVERELIGEDYQRVLAETARLVSYQWREHLERSTLKGFLFHGGVGIGKTTMARRLTYELCRLFGDDGTPAARDNNVVLAVIDGADIARGRYGDTEERLRDVFEYARTGDVGSHGHHDDGEAVQRTVLLFDDVESLFLTRKSVGAREWHFSQNAVLFHSIDELDTAHTVVVLTTNRLDLVDDAIVDRFMTYEFAAPSQDVLEQVAREKARLQHLTEHDLAPVLRLIHMDGHVRSIREIERLVQRAYVDKVLSV